MSDSSLTPEYSPATPLASPSTAPAHDNPTAAVATVPAPGGSGPAEGGGAGAGETGPYVPSDTLAEDSSDTARPGPRYQPRRLHRQGGLGAVWLARDTLLGRDVALKSIRPDRAATPEQVARFTHEARVTSRLEHPSIVPLYDWIPDGGEAGAPEDGSAPHGPRYVMRFISGRTLTETAADYHRKRAAGTATRLDLASLLDAFVSVCRAVAHAHDRGILHRDLKGANVVLGSFGEVFLVDWGLAKSSTDGAAATPEAGTAVDSASIDAQTAAGAVVGTPAFMAPEVAAGKPATKQSDVYGLGAILYEILAGRAPYSGKGAAEVLARVAAGDPAPVRSANPAAPAALEAICRKAMARNPAERYGSAEEVATEVRRWLADEPVSAYPEPWTARAARWARRHRTSVIAAAVLLATAAAASSIAAVLVWRERQHTKAEQINATRNADAAIEVVRDLSTYVESYEMGVGNSTANQRWANLDKALASYERLSEVLPEDRTVRWNVARMYRMRANLSRFLDKFDDAEQSYHRANQLFDQLAADYPEESSYREVGALTMLDFSQFLQRLGRYKEAAQMGDGTIRLFEELLRAHPNEPKYQRQVAQLLMGRSDRELQVGRLAEAEQSARRSAELYARLAELPGSRPEPIDPLFHAMADHNLALVLREQGRVGEALEAHDRAVERMTGMTKATNSRDAWSFLHRVRTERAWTMGQDPGRAAAAIADLEGAILGWDKLIKQLKENPVDLQRKGVARFYCGRLKALRGQREAAVKDLAEAAQIQEGLVEKQAQVPAYRYDLGRTWTALGQLAKEPSAAADWYRKARAMLDAAIQRYPENYLYRRAQKELDALSPPKP
jgi:eukaryotic-like serine/threonine-protein kinase